ncbi:MAG: hypothetical protein ABR587_05405 [Candidatus Binatia bacterium]
MPWIVSAAALFGLTNCGIYGGDGGGGGPTANVGGDIAAVLPDDTGRDIIVFVYQLGDVENEDCEEPELPDDSTRYKFEILEAGETTFTVPNSRIGRLVVAFLLDGEGRDADGRIDPGDPVAVLNDPGCVLDDVPENYVVDIADTRINFSDDDQVGFPDPGRADADISESPDN